MYTHPALVLPLALASLLAAADAGVPAAPAKPAAAAAHADGGTPAAGSKPAAADAGVASKPAAPAPVTAASLVDGIVAAYGGKPALDAARAMRMTGTIDSPRNGKGDLVRSLERPDRLKIEVHYSAAREVRLLDGPNAWQNGKPVQGLAAQAMALQAFRLDLPSLLGRLKDKVKDLGPAEHGGVPVRRLALSLPGDMEFTVLVDPATSHIVRSETSVGGGAKRVAFATNYSDFRKTGDVLAAFAEENFAGETATGVTKLEKIEVLPELPEATWKVEKVAGAEK
jgi:hypothetical protein